MGKFAKLLIIGVVVFFVLSFMGKCIGCMCGGGGSKYKGSSRGKFMRGFGK